MSMIETTNLTKKFGTFTAVDSITFSVQEGEVFGLLGPNGAGKTTTIRMLCCLIGKSGGSASIDGLDISDKKNDIKIRKMIGIVHDNVGLYEALSAYDNLRFFGRMYETPKDILEQNIEKYLKMLDLWDRRNQSVASFSKGMKQKVSVARALIHDPLILFLDEPTASLDPEATKVIIDVLLDLKKEDRTIFLNTHNLDEAQRICDRIAVIKTKLLAVDSPINLERAAVQHKTILVLDKVNESILNAAKSQNPKKIETDGSSLIIEFADPENETPNMISAIVGVGGKIRSVSQSEASLEDVYLKLVRGAQ